MKQIKFDKEARKKLVDGVETTYRAVCATLSPKGRNAAISRSWGIPIVVHDGVTVSNAIDSEDPLEKMGIDLVVQAARKTVEECGDGTTTSILLAREIVSRGMALVENGVNPMTLRREIYEVLEECKKKIPEMSREIKGQEDMERVATISSNDPDIGKLVAQAINKIGTDGLVTVDESHTSETFIDYTEGMTFNSGISVLQFVTNPNRMEALIENPAIAVIDKKITLNSEIVPLLTVMAKNNKNIVIFGELAGDALTTVVLNKMRGTINAMVINPPGYGDRREAALQDISIMTGATVFSKELGMEPEQFANSFKDSWLGTAKRVIADKKSSIIVEGGGDKAKILEEIKRIRELKKTDPNQFEREKYEERLARMTSGVAVIKVGGKTEIETRERVERVKDAIGAAQAAAAEGIVPGSGTAFIRLSEHVTNHMKPNNGTRMMIDVMRQVTHKVMTNSGEDDTRSFFGLLSSPVDDMIDAIYDSSVYALGYDVTDGQLKNMEDAGIIDPAKVIRCSLENAVAVATSILTTDVLVCTVDENKG